MESAEEAGVLDFHALVHDDFEAGIASALGGLVVDDAKLHPDDLGADFDGFFNDGRYIFRHAEDVYDVDGFGNVFHRGVGSPAEDFVRPGIHRDDVVALGEQIPRGEVAGPVLIARETHHGDVAVGAEDAQPDLPRRGKFRLRDGGARADSPGCKAAN